MAVIAIPIGAADDFETAFHSAFRALTFSAPSALAGEPFVALASPADGWGSPAYDKVLAERDLLQLGDGPLAGRIHDSIASIYTRRLRAQYENREVAVDPRPASADLVSPIVIVPVLRVATAEHEARLAEVAAAVDEALEPLSTQFVRREISASAFAFVPWVHLEPPFANQPPDPALFTGPRRIRGGKSVPILHASTSGTQWSEKGRIRLIADLLALYGFSRRSDAASWLSPPNWADVDAFHTFVTSFVELPIIRSRRQHVFRQLEEELLATNEQVAKLPSERSPESLETRAKRALLPLNTLVDRDDVKPEAFGPRESPLGITISLGPADRWAFVDVDATRRSEALHDETVQAVRGGVSHRVRTVADAALHEFRENLRTVETSLTQQIQTVLNEARTGLGVTIASSMRFCDLLALEMPELPPETNGVDIEQVVRQAVGRRDGWIADEERQWQAGSRLPTMLSVVVASFITLIGAGATSYLLFDMVARAREWHPAVPYVLAFVLGVAAAGWYLYIRETEIREYFAEWRALEGRIRDDIAGFVRSLVRVANRRVKAMKIATLPGLERAIHAVKVRLRTERQGVLSLIRNELDTGADEEPARPGDGWFRIPLSAVEATITPDALDKVRALMSGVINLHDYPRPIEISKHEDVLYRDVVSGVALDERDDVATDNLIRAGVDYANNPRLALDIDDDRTFASLRNPAIHAFTPANLRERVNRALNDSRFEVNVYTLVPELVVIANVRSHRVLRAGSETTTEAMESEESGGSEGDDSEGIAPQIESEGNGESLPAEAGDATDADGSDGTGERGQES